MTQLFFCSPCHCQMPLLLLLDGTDEDEEEAAVDLRGLAGRLGGYSGADIEGLCRCGVQCGIERERGGGAVSNPNPHPHPTPHDSEAAMVALREGADAVGGRHFIAALAVVPPSLPWPSQAEGGARSVVGGGVVMAGEQ